MHTEPDGQIADGLRVGDPDAWAALYRTHFDAVWRSVARLVGPNSADVAERLAQWLDGRDTAPPVALAAAEQAEAVRDVLAELPKDYRSLLVAKYCDNASVETIARAEDSSAGAIRSKLARARRAFREIFTKWSNCDEDPAGARHEQ